jgi:hypothetical protein
VKLQQIDVFDRGSSSFSEDGHYEHTPRATKHRIRASAPGNTDPAAHDSRHLTRRLRPPSCWSFSA